jgi:hypothetical protein
MKLTLTLVAVYVGAATAFAPVARGRAYRSAVWKQMPTVAPAKTSTMVFASSKRAAGKKKKKAQESAARLQLEAKDHARHADGVARAANLGTENTARGLMETRFAMEAVERVRKTNDAADRVLRAETETKRKAEARQRALLSARLTRQGKIYADKRERQDQLVARHAAIMEARRPKSDEENIEVTKRYESISNLNERAFQILLDLGIIDTTPDPSSDEYDSSMDHEIAAETIFV